MSRREIGSEFWEVPVQDRPTHAFPPSARWFLSGRSALQAILREVKDCRRVAMPSWCCDSMVKPFIDAGFEVRFYPVYWREGRLFQEVRPEGDVLFVMDYFGYTADAPGLTGYDGVIVRDVTHSVFSAHYSDADYSFGSLRKWCGVWTGGYAWTGDGHPLQAEQGDGGYTALRREAMALKGSYIRGKGSPDKGYLNVFEAAEKALEGVGAAPAAQRDVELALRIDGDAIRSRRRANAAILREAFSKWLLFPEMKETDCPMFVPVLIPGGKRDALRRYLADNEIYCPVHWPVSRYHRLDERMGFLYENELSLVCDQRYSAEDMDRMAAAIRKFWKEA